MAKQAYRSANGYFRKTSNKTEYRCSRDGFLKHHRSLLKLFDKHRKLPFLAGVSPRQIPTQLRDFCHSLWARNESSTATGLLTLAKSLLAPNVWFTCEKWLSITLGAFLIPPTETFEECFQLVILEAWWANYWLFCILYQCFSPAHSLEKRLQKSNSNTEASSLRQRYWYSFTPLDRVGFSTCSSFMKLCVKSNFTTCNQGYLYIKIDHIGEFIAYS